MYRYQDTYGYRPTRIRQPHLITLWLAVIVATVVMLLTTITLAFLLTGWPLK